MDTMEKPGELGRGKKRQAQHTLKEVLHGHWQKREIPVRLEPTTSTMQRSHKPLDHGGAPVSFGGLRGFNQWCLDNSRGPMHMLHVPRQMGS